MKEKRKFSKLKPPHIFTIAALVEAGYYSQRSFYRFIKTGQLKAMRYKKGGRYFIREKDLFEFLTDAGKT